MYVNTETSVGKNLYYAKLKKKKLGTEKSKCLKHNRNIIEDGYCCMHETQNTRLKESP